MSQLPAALDRRENLPGLLARAGQRLLDARSSAEVLEAKKLAELALHYAKVTQAANETHADCLRIITRAEMRMANEIDKGQASGEIAANGQHGEAVLTSDSLGLDRRRVAEWRDVRDAGEEIVETALQKALAEGRSPTKAEILEAAKRIRDEKTAARKQENETTRAAKIAMPDGRFDVIVMDPPWPMEKIEREVRPNQVAFDYPVMSEEELADYAPEVEGRTADDCHLFMWTTQKFLPLALRLVEHYGFRYVCMFVWHKAGGFQPIGLPQYNCEFVLYARRGSPKFTDTKAFPCCFEAPRREHSRKPDEFYATVARVTGGRRADWFTRERRDGFEPIGNEIEKFADELV